MIELIRGNKDSLEGRASVYQKIDARLVLDFWMLNVLHTLKGVVIEAR